MEQDNVKYFKVDGRFVQALHDYIVARPFKEVANLVGGFGEITEIAGAVYPVMEQSAPLHIAPLSDEGTAHC